MDVGKRNWIPEPVQVTQAMMDEAPPEIRAVMGVNALRMTGAGLLAYAEWQAQPTPQGQARR